MVGSSPCMESSQLYFTESLSKVINSTLEGTYSYIIIIIILFYY